MSDWHPESGLHVFDASGRPGVPADIIVSVGGSEAEAKTRIRDDRLIDDELHDSMGRLNADEHYAGLSYLGTFYEVRNEAEHGGWIAKDISTAVIAGDLPTQQYHDIFDFLREHVRGTTQIECLKPDCRATRAYLMMEPPEEDDLQCRTCGSRGVIAVKPETLQESDDTDKSTQ